MKAITLLILAVLLFPALSWATMHKVKICFKYVVDYDDALAGDYWTDNDNDKIAFGIYAKIIRESDGHTMFNDYTNVDTGCTPEMWLSSLQHFDIYAWSKASINNNYVIVKEHADGSEYIQQLGNGWSPSEDKSYYFHYLDGQYYGEDNSYLVAASSYALHEKPGGVNGDTLEVVNDPCPDGDWNCLGDDERVYIAASSRDDKYIIAHEIGHWIGTMRNGGYHWKSSYDWENTICHEWYESGAGHDLFSMEQESAAVKEGWVDFYAAALWNSKDDNDCEFWTDPLDYDRDGQADGIYIYSCVEGSSYELEYCEDATCMSTEYDWMRFWWYWHSDGGKSVNDLVELIVASDPDNWYANNVYQELSDSADTRGYNMFYWAIMAIFLGLTNCV